MRRKRSVLKAHPNPPVVLGVSLIFASSAMAATLITCTGD